MNIKLLTNNWNPRPFGYRECVKTVILEHILDRRTHSKCIICSSDQHLPEATKLLESFRHSHRFYIIIPASVYCFRMGIVAAALSQTLKRLHLTVFASSNAVQFLSSAERACAPSHPVSPPWVDTLCCQKPVLPPPMPLWAKNKTKPKPV